MPHRPGHDTGRDDIRRPEGQIAGNPNASVPPSPLVNTILGWSWLGRWDGEGEDPHVAPIVKAFIDKWEAEFRKLSAEGNVQLAQDALIRKFEEDLYKQDWFQEKNNAWQAITKMRYGTDTPLGEWDNLIETTKEYVNEYLRDLGFADWQGNLTVEYDEQFIEDLIYDTAKVGGYGLPMLDSNLANAYIEKEWIPSRGFDTQEGEFTIGEGTLRDLYKELKRLADNNYVSIPDEELWDMVSRIKREDMNIQGAYNMISNRVADQFDFLHNSPIMERINSFNASTRSGLGSLKSHLSPVITSVANAWELDNNEINLQDMFGQGLENLITGSDNDRRFMNSREARDWARLQPQYKQTQDYGMRMGSITQELLRTFGAA